MKKKYNSAYSEGIRHTQEQAVAAWVAELNWLRFKEYVESISQQDGNLKKALEELAELKEFIGNPEHILGSTYTKHGEIAEHVQVNIANARKLIEGLEKEFTFDGVGRTAPEDYLNAGIKVQSKFCNGTRNTLQAIREHLEKYPDFIEQNGYYHIPENQYEEIMQILEKSKTAPSSLSKSEMRILEIINKFSEETGIDISKDIKPSLADYKDVQQGTVNKTIAKEESAIRKRDQQKREEAYNLSKPTLKEGGKVTAISAVTEGGLSFCLTTAKKLKEKKSMKNFSPEDWKDIGIDSSASAAKGAVRGATVYGLTNFAHAPANIASAYVTASLGILSQLKAYRNEKISREDMLINCEVLSLDVTVSALSAMLGQTLIPLPVLGAIIGTVAGEFVYNICKQKASDAEAELIKDYYEEIRYTDLNLQREAEKILAQLKKEEQKFTCIEDMVFDEELNTSFYKSVKRAELVGVSPDKLVRNLEKLNTLMTR